MICLPVLFRVTGVGTSIWLSSAYGATLKEMGKIYHFQAITESNMIWQSSFFVGYTLNCKSYRRGRWHSDLWMLTIRSYLVIIKTISLLPICCWISHTYIKLHIINKRRGFSLAITIYLFLTSRRVRCISYGIKVHATHKHIFQT